MAWDVLMRGLLPKQPLLFKRTRCLRMRRDGQSGTEKSCGAASMAYVEIALGCEFTAGFNLIASLRTGMLRTVPTIGNTCFDIPPCIVGKRI